MDLSAVFRLLLKKMWVIILAALIGGAASYVYTDRVVLPTYETSVALYVSNTAEGNQAPSITTSDMAASMMLMQTCSTVIKEVETLETAIKLSGLDYTAQELLQMVQVEGVENTKIMYIIVKAHNAQEAALIADSIAEITPGIMKAIEPAGSVRILNRAKVPDRKSEPSNAKAALMGVVGGALLAIILLILSAMLNTGLKTAGQLTALGLPVLAIMPLEAGKLKGNLVYSLPGSQCKSILFTEFPPCENDPFTAAEVTGALANDGFRVLLMECNLNYPCLKKKLELRKEPGLTDILIGKVKFESAVQNYKKNVDVITAGTVSVNPDKLLASEEMDKLLDAAGSEYDYILLLSSAEKTDPGVLRLAARVSGNVLITSRKSTRTAALKDYLNSLQTAGANVLGTVFFDGKKRAG